MPRLLEELQRGTPVLDSNGSQIGEIRAVYASGDARTAEFLLVYWNARGEEALVPSDEAMQVDDRGVTLRQPAEWYDDRPAFNPSANPLLHKL
ncbi:MAG TPA: hypothetical protein VKT72_00240 [Candidatus Baltobacteraceae bacterium]|nr:hypothetical protein [Candidatus Baltobacteraceae bacterium]